MKFFQKKDLTTPHSVCIIAMRLEEWCNGSTTDSDSVCWGSNPYSSANKKDITLCGVFFLFV